MFKTFKAHSHCNDNDKFYEFPSRCMELALRGSAL